MSSERRTTSRRKGTTRRRRRWIITELPPKEPVKDPKEMRELISYQDPAHRVVYKRTVSVLGHDRFIWKRARA